ncbi:MAG: NPCBM/NEW2 domain-containing protein [Planctomycetaceae bacterium]|nr:NPCBM/NEW2 domain-containing protein [Planctomycetaceae bacterium]
MFTLFLSLCIALPTDVQITRLSGASETGKLESISTESLLMQSGGQSVTIPVSDLLLITMPGGAGAASADPQRLILRDGSEISGTAGSRTAKAVSLTSGGLGAIEIPVDAVESIRLQADNPTFRPQWETFRKRETTKDLLIVAKRDGSGLDFLAGVVSSFDSEKLEFLLDGETVPVPLARVYGVVFGKADGAAPSAMPAGKLSLGTGDQLAMKEFTSAAGQLQVVTTWGQTLPVPLDAVRQIDLSGGRLAYLSDLAALEEKFLGADPENSLLSGLATEEQQQLLFGPRRDITIQRQSKLRLRGREFSKGLCIHSKTEMSWALDQKYRSLECLAGIDDEVASNGTHAVQLIIRGDDKVLFDRMITSTDEPIPVQLSVEGVSTLHVTVDYGDGESICDWLDLADAKLLLLQE